MDEKQWMKNFLENQQKWKYVAGAVALALFCLLVFFFSFFKVTTVEVMDCSYYSKEEIQEMVLDGAFTGNSILAPFLYTKENVKDVPFVSAFRVTRLSRNTICITVKEETPVGCIAYLDSYIYFNREGVFTESAKIRDEKVPFYAGILPEYVVKGESLPIKGRTVLSTAITLSSIFEKNDLLPDYIEIVSSSDIDLVYGDIRVQLGENQYLEDKMARVLAILPKLDGEKGVLHMENITDHVKTVTFEREIVEITAENWSGGYDENGDYTGDGEYDKNGRYIGARPKSAYDYAVEAWPGGYDGEGDYTGAGEFDSYGQYVGSCPTEESIAENGDWLGGYDEEGRYVTYGEFDREGGYVGPNPLWEDSGYEDSEDYDDYENEDSWNEDSWNGDSWDDDSWDDDSWDDDSWNGNSWYDDSEYEDESYDTYDEDYYDTDYDEEYYG